MSVYVVCFFSFICIYRHKELNEVHVHVFQVASSGFVKWCVFLEFSISLSYPYCPNLCLINNKYIPDCASLVDPQCNRPARKHLEKTAQAVWSTFYGHLWVNYYSKCICSCINKQPYCTRCFADILQLSFCWWAAAFDVLMVSSATTAIKGRLWPCHTNV